jgi:CheY-like chemotaxis protein
MPPSGWRRWSIASPSDPRDAPVAAHLEEPGGPVSRPPTEAGSGDLQPVIRAARRAIEELAAVVSSMEALSRGHEALRDRAERLEREREALRVAGETARRERDEAIRALTEMRAAHDAARSERQAGRPVPPGKVPSKVMVVDDAQSELRMIEAILRSAGFQVLALGDGDGIEDKVALERPDVLLLDIVMPKRNGYEILRALKRDERTKRTPVVIVTSRNQESDRVWSRQQGADEYLTKPFTAEQLLAVVRQFVR